MLYVIHTSPKRTEFVNEYMIPSFLEQGIKPIVWNDAEMVGQLPAWVDCAKWILENYNIYDGTWHLEDDVVLCKDFRKKTEELSNRTNIVQGFRCKWFSKNLYELTGMQPVKNLMPGSQCIFIPNYYLIDFVRFFDEKIKTGQFLKSEWDRGVLYSDNAFKRYLKKNFPDAEINQLEDSLVDHVDYLLGGSSMNVNREHLVCRAVKFDNCEEVLRLEGVYAGREKTKA